MKHIVSYIVLILLSCSISAQDFDEQITQLLDAAYESAEKDDFVSTCHNYKQTINLIIENELYEYGFGIERDLVVYLVEGWLEREDMESAKNCLKTIVNLYVESFVYWGNLGYYDNRQDLLNDVYDCIIGLGQEFNKEGSYDLYGSCLMTMNSIFHIFDYNSEDSVTTQESLALLYAEKYYNHTEGLKWAYEAFKTSVSLFGKDAELSKRVFTLLLVIYKRSLERYCLESFDFNRGRRKIEDTLPPPVPYEVVCETYGAWEKIRMELSTQYGETVFHENLLPEYRWLLNLWGKDSICLGTPEFDAFIKTLTAIHFFRIDDFSCSVLEMFKCISNPVAMVDYALLIHNALVNSGFLHELRWFEDLYIEYLREIGSERLLEEQELLGLSMYYHRLSTFGFGHTDDVWEYVSDVAQTIFDDNFIPKYKNVYTQKVILFSFLCRLYAEDESLSIKALEKCIALLSQNFEMEDSGFLSNLYVALAYEYYNEKRYDLAIEALEKAYGIERDLAIKNNRLEEFENGAEMPVITYEQLAMCHAEKGNLEQAETLFQKCLDYYSNYNPSNASIYETIGSFYRKKGDHHRSREFYESYFSVLVLRYIIESRGLRKDERMNAYVRTTSLSNFLLQIPLYALEDNCFIDMAFDAVLLKKGFHVKEERRIKDNIIKSNDKKLLKAYYAYKDAERLGMSTKQDLEDDVMFLYSQHREFFQSWTFTTWQDVQSLLRKHEIAIEFTLASTSEGSLRYVAMIIRPDWEMPKIVDLGSDREFHKYILSSKAYRNNDEFYQLVWKKVEPYLNGIQTIYFSPDGAFCQLNIEVLENEKGLAMNKKYNMYRLSSTAEIDTINKEKIMSTATLFGGLNYDTSLDDLQANSRRWVSSSNSFSDEFLRDDSTRHGVSYLPGTLREVTLINKILRGHDIESYVFTYNDGTEDAFKSMSGNSTSILHVATHGFYFDEDDAGKQIPFIDSQNRPLRRCGLILSGGQHAWLGKTLPFGIEDGIITGEEIAGMDLSETDLLILSACQTGLGDMGWDGVLGLQRGFKIAGVGTIIMSLWEVDDAATELMMTKLYTYMMAGKSKRDAFDAAIMAVKKEFENPEYWAAFIMLD